MKKMKTYILGMVLAFCHDPASTECISSNTDPCHGCGGYHGCDGSRFYEY